MSSMDEILRRSLLFDFYGELLTDHQKEIYEAFNSEDLSLGEIAAQAGISRQGVHDLIRRADASLEMYEEKLHLMERFLKVQSQAGEIRDLAGQIASGDGGSLSGSEMAGRIVELTDEILEEL